MRFPLIGCFFQKSVSGCCGRYANQNTLLKGLEVINELVKSGRLHAEGEYEIIRTPERLKEVMETYLTGVSEYVLDVETTGLDVYNDILVGICLYNPDLPKQDGKDTSRYE